MTEQVRYLVELRPVKPGERYISNHDRVSLWDLNRVSHTTWPVVVGESREDRPQPRQTRPESPESDETTQPGTPLPLNPLPAAQAVAYGRQSKWFRMCETRADGGLITYKPYAEWPAPKPGTHESDQPSAMRLDRWQNNGYVDRDDTGKVRKFTKGGHAEYAHAQAWSRANAPKATQ